MKKLNSLKVAGFWFMLVLFIAVTVFIGAFREKYNLEIVTEQEWHEYKQLKANAADADYYAQLKRNLDKVN